MPSLTARTFAVLTTVPATVLGLTAVASPSLASSLAPPGCGESFSGGGGTTADPYLISSAADFTALNGDSDCWAGEFLQTANIDMGGITWDIEAGTPASTTGTDATPFSGTYDGGTFEVSGLTIDVGTRPADDNGGLFGVVTGTIRNLGFVDTDLTTETVTADDVAGGLVGSLRGGTVSNSFTTVYVYTDDNYAGGLVGEAYGNATIENSYSTGTVEGDGDSVGGLVGDAYDGTTIENSYSTGTVEGDGDSVGGLVGAAYDGTTIENSYSTGTVEGDGDYTGGLVGALEDSTSIVRDSHSTASVTSTDTYAEETGGLIGYLNLASVVNSYATGDVSGVRYVGGLVGSVNRTGSISGAYATGAVENDGSAGEVGGLVGVVEAAASVSNCYATGSVSGGYSGGLVSDNKGTVSNCYSIGYVDGDREGGLVQVNTGTVSNSFWNTVTSDQTSSAGGTGKTTSELKTLETFTSAGWSITKGWSSSSPPVWGFCAQMNNGYPFLNWSADVNPCGDGPFAEFTFSLPTGEECTSISPMRATIGQQTRLPGADAACATMPGSKIIGWTVPASTGYTGIGSTAMPFEPGHLVNVVGAQQFTAVLWEPVIEFRYDANVGVGGACEPGEATHTSNNGHLAHIWVPREDFTDARFPTTTPCTPPGHELQAWNSDGDGTGQTYTPGNPLPETWVSDTSNTHTLYGIWRYRPAG